MRMAVTPRLSDPDFDVKLGRGGMREIEFFTQVQQLILGGRLPICVRLRNQGHVGAQWLKTGVITQEVGENLAIAYDFLRWSNIASRWSTTNRRIICLTLAAKRTQIASLGGYQIAGSFRARSD